MKGIEFVPTNYPSDTTDKEWELIKSFFPPGNKSRWHKRSLVDAVFYIEETGCQWRQLPHDYPPYSTVWSFYRRVRESGLWGKMMDELVKKVRIIAGRQASPRTYGLIDSQSAKTVAASAGRGFDGGKRVKGRKRHIVVDVMGNLLAVVVHAANIHDTKSGINPAKQAYEKYPTIKKFCGDDGYRKSLKKPLRLSLVWALIYPRASNRHLK